MPEHRFVGTKRTVNRGQGTPRQADEEEEEEEEPID
jgi:hypothetical protein